MPAWLRIPNREDNLFSIFFLTALVIPLMFVPIYYEGYEIIKYVLLLVFAGIGGLILFNRKQLYIHKSLLWMLIGLWLLHLVSTIFSLDILNSIIGIRGRYAGSLLSVTALVMFIIIAWSAIKQDQSRKLTLLRILMFDGLLMSILSITQYLGIFFYSGIEVELRSIVPGFLGNQNFTAMFLLATLPLVPILWQDAKMKWAKYYYAFTGIVVIWALVLCASRGALLGLGAMIFVFIIISVLRKYPKVYLYSAIIAAVVAIIFYFGFFTEIRSDTLTGGQLSSSYSTQTRYSIWSDSLEVIKKHPVFGTGSGNFEIGTGAVDDIALAGSGWYDDAHNIFLQKAATDGLPSLVLFIAVLGVCLMIAWRETKYQKPVALWETTGLVGVLVASSFNPVAIPVWFVLIMLVAFASSPYIVQRSIKKPYRVIILVVSVTLIVAGTFYITSETLSMYGARAYKHHDDQKTVQLMKSSLFFNPFNGVSKVFLISAEINLNDDPKLISEKIEALVAQHPNQAWVNKNSGDLYYRLFEKTNNPSYQQRMGELYDRAINLLPYFVDAYTSSAYAHFKVGSYEKALQLLNKGLSIPVIKESPYPLVLYAKVNFELGNNEAGVEALEKVNAKYGKNLIVAKYIEQIKNGANPKDLIFPVTFPEIDISL